MERQATLIRKRLFVFIAVILIGCTMLSVTGVAAEAVASKTTKVEQNSSTTDPKITLSGYGLSKTSIKLTWTTKTSYTRFTIYRSKDGGSFKKVTSVTDKSYTDKELKTGSTYTYKVIGVSGKTKVTSNEKSINPFKYVTPYAYQGDRSHTIIEWNYSSSQLSAVTGFIVYRKAEGEKSYTKLGKLSKKGYLCRDDDGKYIFQYFDTASKYIGKTYYYKVYPYCGSKKGYSKIGEITVQPYVYLSTTSDSVTIKWSSFKGAKSYVIYTDIYKFDSEGYPEFYKTKKLGTYSSKDTKVHVISNISTKKYLYVVYVEAHKPVDGVDTCIGYYGWVDSESPYALMRNVASSKSLSTVKVINARGEKKKTAWTETLTSSEKKLFKEFEELHFQKGMTKAEKALYVNYWIHRNVDYDYEYKISSKYSYSECIFKYKKGQCIQYNGAYAHYLAYLGFESRIIQGYRGKSVSHFWGEIKLSNRWYCMETGNYGKNGSWRYVCERYGPWGASNYNICGVIS